MSSLTLWPSSAALLGELRHRAKGNGAGLALEDAVLADFVQSLARQDPAGSGTLDGHACKLLLHDVVQERGSQLSSLPLADPLLVDLASNALNAAQEASVSPADMMNAAAGVEGERGARLRALALLYSVFDARKQQQKLMDAGDALQAAVRAVETRRVPLPDTVVIKGLLDLTPARHVFLRALARCCHLELHLPDISDQASALSMSRPALAAYLEPVLEALYRNPVDGLTLVHDPLTDPGSAMAPLLQALFTTRRAEQAPATVSAFADVVGEAEAVADACVRWLMTHAAPADICVVVRRPSERDDVLADALAARGLTLWRRSGYARRTAFARGVLLLLRAAEGRIHVHELESLAALCGARPAQARAYSHALCSELRAVGMNGRGGNVLAHAAERTPGVEGVAAALKALPDVASMDAHVRALQDALRHLGGLESHVASRLRDPLAGDEAWSRTAFRKTLENLCTAARRAGSRMLTRGAFLAHLEGALTSPGTPPSASAIELCSAPDVVGRRFRCVALMGVMDGVFPELTPPNPLLGEEDRLVLNARLDRGAFRTEGGEGRLRSPPRDRLEPLLFATAVASARERLLVTMSETGMDGSVQSGGPFFQEMLRVLGQDAPLRPLPPPTHVMRRRAAGVMARLSLPGAEPALVARLHALAGRRTRTGPHAGILGPQVGTPIAARFGGTRQHPTSATALQLMGSCPFRFALEQVMRLPGYPPTVDVPPAHQLGTLAHRVLERFLKPRLQQPWQVPQAAERVEIRELVLAGASEVDGNRAIKHAALETLAERLIRTLTQLAQRPPLPGAIPVEVEMPFGSDGGALRLCLPGLPDGDGDGALFIKGTIDRVDALPDGTAVATDYKLGSARATSEALRGSHLGTRHLQLPIYLLALEAGGAPATVGYLWSLRDARASPRVGHGGRFTLRDVLHGHPAIGHDGMLAHASGLVANLRGGNFGVKPEVGVCEGCPHGAVCRIQEMPPMPHDAPVPRTARAHAA